jgi:hypothetical protein
MVQIPKSLIAENASETFRNSLCTNPTTQPAAAERKVHY